jgi:transcriptional regulator with XRE-family HTH domain
MLEFKKSGITRAELAVRTGKSKAQISRLLGQPRNLTTDTMGELLFAISGKEMEYNSADPFQRESKSSKHGDAAFMSMDRLHATSTGIAFIRSTIDARGTIVPRGLESIQAVAA